MRVGKAFIKKKKEIHSATIWQQNGKAISAKERIKKDFQRWVYWHVLRYKQYSARPNQMLQFVFTC